VAESLGHLALALVTLLSWFGLGSLLLVRARFDDGLLGILNRTAVGAIAFALLTFAASLVGLIYDWLYLPLLAAVALVGAVAMTRLVRSLDPRPAWRRLPGWQRALVGLLLLYAVLDVIAAAAPVSSADAVLVHAATPLVYAREHHAVQITGIWTTYQPFTVEMLVLDGELLWGPIQGAFAPLMLGLLATVALIGGVTRFAGRALGLLAGVVLLAQPYMCWQTTSTFVEPALMLTMALALWNYGESRATSKRVHLVLLGVMLGATCGMKYTGLVATGAFLVGMAVAGLPPRRLLWLVAAPAVLLALPWYVKNAVQTGNPLYPFYFGGPDAEAMKTTTDILAAYGAGHGPLDAILLPVRLLLRGGKFDRGEFLSPLFILFAPLALLARGWRREAIAAWAGSLVFLGWWFSASQQVRYVGPALPVLAALAAMGMVELARGGPVAAWVVKTVTAGTLALGLAITLVYVAQFVPVVVGAQSREAFLTDKTSYYGADVWLNRHLPANARVLMEPLALLYLDREYVPWNSASLPSAADASSTRAFVRRHRITDIAVIRGHGASQQQVGYLPARLIGRVKVRIIVSRTRGTDSKPQTVLVYHLASAK
jgi:hypothetical protein